MSIFRIIDESFFNTTSTCSKILALGCRGLVIYPFQAFSRRGFENIVREAKKDRKVGLLR